MGRRMGVREAAAYTGLSEHAIRIGCKRGIFPYFKVGLGKGHIILDTDMLDEAITSQMLENQAQAKIAAQPPEQFFPGIRKVRE